MTTTKYVEILIEFSGRTLSSLHLGLKINTHRNRHFLMVKELKSSVLKTTQEEYSLATSLQMAIQIFLQQLSYLVASTRLKFSLVSLVPMQHVLKSKQKTREEFLN